MQYEKHKKAMGKNFSLRFFLITTCQTFSEI
jgi:hypothetical protein